MNKDNKIEKLDGLSMDLEKMNKDKLKSVFPECFIEDKLDIDKLLGLCGEYIIEDFEKYKFEWKGKSECLQLAQKRSSGTLRPCPEESVDFENTKNVYIEGDNLEVLKLLQTAYFNRIKMIYIDPPYNTGHDFVYEDDFKDPIERYKTITSQATKSSPETMGRFHTRWLNMMYPRLRLAANLLRDDGVIFISIDDSEIHNLRKLCDEVFGEENFIAQINWKGRGGRQDSKYYAVVHEYILCYCKSIYKFVVGEEIKEEENYPKYDEKRKLKYKTQLLRKWGSNSKRSDRPNLFYPITTPDGTKLYPMLSKTEEGCWRWGRERMEKEIKNGNIEFIKDKLGNYIAYEKIYEPSEGEIKTKKYTTWIDEFSSGIGTNIIKNLFDNIVFDYSKPVELIQRFINMSNTKENDIILDFFSGSATTAHAVMQLNAEDGGNRQFIMVQLPELCNEKSEAYKAGYKNICEIGKERIRRAGKKILSENNQLKLDNIENELDIGFKVFKLDTSNLYEWDAEAIKEDLTLFRESLNKMLDKVKDDRTELDVVYEVILKMGIPLDMKVSESEVNNRKVYIIGERCLLLICLEKELSIEDVEKMAEFKPVNIILLKQSFADSSVLLNAHYSLRDLGIEIKLI